LSIVKRGTIGVAVGGIIITTAGVISWNSASEIAIGTAVSAVIFR
jgi:Na+-transporting NADH:ubiquinone oxidoreductase subunit NqrB